MEYLDGIKSSPEVIYLFNGLLSWLFNFSK